MKGALMIPAWFYKPEPTPDADSGYSGTILPPLPYYTADGGTSHGSSNTPFDGGNARYMPVITNNGGHA